MKITITPINVRLQAREQKLIIYTSGCITSTGGSSIHNELSDRDAADAHPISSITGLSDALVGKQATLVSGTNIKTVNGETLLGSGDIEITGGGGGFTKQTLSDAASISWDVANGNYATVTIAGDRTIANPTNLTVGQTLLIDITQGTGGGHTIANWGSYFTWNGGVIPILSSGEGNTDSLEFLVVSATEIRFRNANFDV